MPRIKKCKVLNVDKLGYIYVGTEYFGMYKSTEPVNSFGEQVHAVCGSLMVYPNPSSEKVHIIIDKIQDGSKVNLNIYDIFGKRIDIDGNVIISPETGEIIWDCSSVATGIYFVQIGQKTTAKIIPVIVNR